MLSLLFLTAFAANVDRAPSGAIVTVRPSEGERACVLDSQERPLALCAELSQPFWLVHPDAWRNAVAIAESEKSLKITLGKVEAKGIELEAQVGDITAKYNALVVSSVAERAATDQKLKNKNKAMWAVGGVGVAAGVTLTVIGMFSVGVL